MWGGTAAGGTSGFRRPPGLDPRALALAPRSDQAPGWEVDSSSLSSVRSSPFRVGDWSGDGAAAGYGIASMLAFSVGLGRIAWVVFAVSRR